MSSSEQRAAVLAILLLIAGSVGAQSRSGYGGNDGLGMGTIGSTNAGAIGIDPIEYLTTWNFNNLPENERADFYKESKLSNGQLLREYWFYAQDRDIEIAPRGNVSGLEL